MCHFLRADAPETREAKSTPGPGTYDGMYSHKPSILMSTLNTSGGKVYSDVFKYSDESDDENGVVMIDEGKVVHR